MFKKFMTVILTLLIVFSAVMMAAASEAAQNEGLSPGEQWNRDALDGNLGEQPDNFGQFKEKPDIHGQFAENQRNLQNRFISMTSGINMNSRMAQNNLLWLGIINDAGMGDFYIRLARIQYLSRHQVYEHDPEILAESERLRERHEENFEQIKEVANMDTFLQYSEWINERRAAFGR